MINGPRFLTFDEVLEIHLDQVTLYGGSTELRDRGLLESAVMSPRAMFNGEYLHTDLVEMAAAYLFHLVANHAFVDGNKRVGTVAMLVFLDFNSVEWVGDDSDLYACVIGIAQGQIDKRGVTDFLRPRLRS